MDASVISIERLSQRTNGCCRMLVDIAQQFQAARSQHLGQGLKRIERQVIFPNALTLLVTTHSVLDALAYGFEVVANMNLQFAHGSPPAFRTSAKKSANSWSRLVNEYDLSVPAMCMWSPLPRSLSNPTRRRPVRP